MTLLAGGNILRNIHEPADCEGRGCWVQHPSDWPLNAAPVYWDSVGRRAFRQCQHGNFHWDLDDHAYVTRFSAKWATMPPWRCAGTDNCGCCRAG